MRSSRTFPAASWRLLSGPTTPIADRYRADMRKLIDKVLSAGKQPVVPTIPYTAEPAHLPLIPKLNAMVRELYATYAAKLTVGPDLYDVLYRGRRDMFDRPDDLHPNERGNAAIRQAWADAMVAAVYRPAVAADH